jgi:hypothetical protein
MEENHLASRIPKLLPLRPEDLAHRRDSGILRQLLRTLSSGRPSLEARRNPTNLSRPVIQPRRHLQSDAEGERIDRINRC